MSSAVQLRSELEVIRGMDDIPLIFDPVTGNYHRITQAGVTVLSFLDGAHTKEDLIDLFSRSNPDRSEKVRKQVSAFIDTLGQSGLLVGSVLPPKDVKRASGSRFRGDMLMPRIVLTRSLPKILEPVAALLRQTPVGALAAFFAVGAVLGFGLAAHALFVTLPPVVPEPGRAFLYAGIVQLMLMFLHETAHALVAQVLRVPIRGLGVAMLFYFMPLAYVDRTDAYRVRGRGGRIALALAGIVSDGWTCGLAGVVAVSSDGIVQQVASYVVVMQLFGLMVNLNPLFQTDGHSAIEAAIGSVDTRGRAFALLKSVVRRTDLPAHLAQLSWRARAAYMAFGLVSLSYVLLAAFMVLRGLIVAVLR